jgi:hypothetical protein
MDSSAKPFYLNERECPDGFNLGIAAFAFQTREEEERWASRTLPFIFPLPLYLSLSLSLVVKNRWHLCILNRCSDKYVLKAQRRRKRERESEQTPSIVYCLSFTTTHVLAAPEQYKVAVVRCLAADIVTGRRAARRGGIYSFSHLALLFFFFFLFFYYYYFRSVLVAIEIPFNASGNSALDLTAWL